MKNTLIKTAREYKGLLLFLVLMVMFRSAIADWNVVPTGSMKPTILEGDRILVNKLAYDIRVPLTHLSLYRLAEPARGDIVVFDSQAADRRLVKRVVGGPGDVVQMVNNRLIVNREPASYVDLKYDRNVLLVTEKIAGSARVVRIDPHRLGQGYSFGPILVPSGHYLVLGDNRNESADSRYYGFVPREEIVGRARTVVVSLDPTNYYLPRDKRYLAPL